MTPGVRAWAGILGFVMAYDTWAILRDADTLSSACWRLNDRPAGRLAVFSLWAALTYHLFVERPFGEEIRDAVLDVLDPGSAT